MQVAELQDLEYVGSLPVALHFQTGSNTTVWTAPVTEVAVYSKAPGGSLQHALAAVDAFCVVDSTADIGGPTRDLCTTTLEPCR